MTCIVLTGLQEAIFRCTMIERDNAYRELVMGRDKPGSVQKEVAMKVWASSIAMTSFYEVVAIICCRMTYLFFRPHRFVFNLGYGFVEGDIGMTTIGMIFISMIMELAFEFLVDILALQIEARHGELGGEEEKEEEGKWQEEQPHRNEKK